MIAQTTAVSPPTTTLTQLPRLARDFFNFISDMHEQHGDHYILKLGLTQFHILSHPDHVKHFLVDPKHNYEKGDNPLLNSTRELIGNGLPMSEGDFWLRQRRMMQPHFHRHAIHEMSKTMFAAVESLLDSEWDVAAESDAPTNVAQLFPHITMRVIMETMFGSDLAEAELEKMTNNMQIILDGIFRGMMTRLLPGWLPIPGRQKYLEAMAYMEDKMYAVIEERRQTPTHDLVSLLVHQTDDVTHEHMTPKQLRDELMTLFLGGYDTTASALGWVLHFFTQEPELQVRLRQEVDEQLAGQRPTLETVQTLSFTENMFKEALRLNPPVYWEVRNAIEVDQFNGYHIEAGADIAVMLYNIHRHPDFWEQPNQFDPDRFTPERSEGRHRYAWAPFGAGRHLCIGREFAMLEARYILARLMQRYRFTAVSGKVAQPRPSLLMSMKDGVWVNISKRPTV